MKKILIIQQKMIGDVLASTVICEAVKRRFPGSEVHYMIQPSTQAVVENNPFVDKIVLFAPSKKDGISALTSFGKELKKENYDAVIDAYAKWESIIPAYFSAAPIRIGIRKWYTRFLYTKTIVPSENVAGSAIHHRLQLAEALTGKFEPIAFPKIYLRDSEIQTAKDQIAKSLQPNVPLIMVSVLGSGKSKSLPNVQMAATLDAIAECGDVQLLFNFMPSQQEEARAIYSLCKKETREKIVFDFYMKGLRAFLAVLSQCDALIGNEGGAVNMAKALDIPTFTIFSPWVKKESWNMLTDDNRHEAVHIADYFPEVYGGKHPKKFRKQVPELYKKLSVELYRGKLQEFVKRIIS